MKFKITYKNPATGEDESLITTPETCQDKLEEIYQTMIPDGKIKPVNIKIEPKFGSGE